MRTADAADYSTAFAAQWAARGASLGVWSQRPAGSDPPAVHPLYCNVGLVAWRMGDYVVCRAEYISNEREARRYYQERYAGMHRVQCRGKEVTIFFEHAATHVYSEEIDGAVPQGATMIRRRLRPGVFEERVFSLDRAQLMDRIIPAIVNFTFSLPGTSADNRENRLLHGPRLPDGRYLRVVLSPGPRASWYVKSAYPIDAVKWRDLRGAKTAKFPP